MKFMENTLRGKYQLSGNEVEHVAKAVIMLGDVWELSYQEMAENLSRFMTEYEFNRVIEEIEYLAE